MKMMRSMTRNSWLAAVVAVLTLPGVSSAQETKRERVVAQFTAAEVEQIDAIVASAVEAGAPADALYDKALEGAAKRVPAARIMPALESYGGRLVQAQELLGDVSTPAFVVAGADALSRGVPANALRSVGSDAGDRGPVALVVLGDLVEAGIPADQAVETVQQALQRDQEPDALLHVPAAVRRLMRDGVPADRAASDVTRLMRDGVSPRRIRDKRGG